MQMKALIAAQASIPSPLRQQLVVILGSCSQGTLACRNDKIMDQALTIHDSILRSMLGKHYGFEVRLV